MADRECEASFAKHKPKAYSSNEGVLFFDKRDFATIGDCAPRAVLKDRRSRILSRILQTISNCASRAVFKDTARRSKILRLANAGFERWDAFSVFLHAKGPPMT